MFAVGWASLAARVRELEETETVAKIKEGTVTIVDRSMDGLSKVSHEKGQDISNLQSVRFWAIAQSISFSAFPSPWLYRRKSTSRT